MRCWTPPHSAPQLAAVDVTQYFNATVPAVLAGLLKDSSPLVLPAGGWMDGGCVAGRCPTPFRFYVLAPLLGPYILVGQVPPWVWQRDAEPPQLGQAVPVSRARFPDLSWTSTSLSVAVAGSAGEAVRVALLFEWHILSVGCLLGSTQRAVLSCIKASCTCQ